MSALNIVLFCAAGFLLGVVISWLVSNIASRIRNRTARRRVEPQMNVKKKGIKTMDLILVIIGVSLVWFTHRMSARTTGGARMNLSHGSTHGEARSRSSIMGPSLSRRALSRTSTARCGARRRRTSGSSTERRTADAD